MDNFVFYAPTFFAFGKDSENDTGSYVKRFGGTKVLIHYGGGSVVRSGLLDRVKASLEKENIPDEISPDNIRKMLDEKAPQTKRLEKKRKNSRRQNVSKKKRKPPADKTSRKKKRKPPADSLSRKKEKTLPKTICLGKKKKN